MASSSRGGWHHDGSHRHHNATMISNCQQSPAYLETLSNVLIKVSGTLSILGCLYILFRYYYYKSRRDITMMLVATLAGIDLVIVIAKFPATAFMYSKHAKDPRNESNYVACQVQAYFMDVAATQAVIWNAVMAFNLLRWVVYRDTQEKLRRRYPWFIISTTVFCILWTMWVALPIHHFKSHRSQSSKDKQSLLGPATFYCWIADPDLALYHFYIFVFTSLIFIIWVVVRIRSEIRKRTFRQLLNHTETALLVIQRQLYWYAISFIVLYIPVSIYRISDAVCDSSEPEPAFCRKVVPTFGVVAQTLINLQGFVNAIIFGGFLTFGCKRSSRTTTDSFLGLVSPSAVLEDNNSSHLSLYMPFECCDHVLLFASTFNMAEGAVPSKPAMESWIPGGRDIYVIGLQECLVLDEMRAAILEHLQAINGKLYTEYKREIGRSHTKLGYHGFIAISVYVPTSDVECGHFEMHMESTSKVHRGKSLIGMGRASNKGAVGFAFRYFNTTFAVVSCHLASDSSGKSKLHKRHKDSASILRSLNPLSAVVEFDFQHLVHHTIFMGDLNYRLTAQKATPQDVLELMVSVLNRPHLRAEMQSQINHFDNLTPETSPYLVLTSPGNDTVLLDDISVVEHQHEDDITKLKSTFHSPVKRDNWTPLLQHDELLSSLQNGAALTGFSEATIAFAPTFRRVLGTRLPENRRVTVGELAAIYSTVVADGGLRVPSYTDRILYHSLPDLHDRIKCLSYLSCEDVLTSDHKPVSSTFQVALEKIPRSLETNGTLRRCVVTLSCIRIQWSSPLETLMTPPSPDVDDEDSPSLTESPVGVLPTTTIMPLPTSIAINAPSNTARRGPIVVRSIFPLPCEDDFHESRELNELAEQLTLHSDQLESSVYSASKTTTLKQFEASGVKQAALFVPKKYMHVAINFQSSSSNGYSIGQCVLSVMHSYHRHGKKTDFHSVLTSGGRHMGEITGKLSFKVDAA